MEVSLFTGGRDRPYALGLVRALMAQDLSLQVVGADELDGCELEPNSRVEFLNLHGKLRQNSTRLSKVTRALSYYVRLIPYAAAAKPKVFHTLWNGKLEYLDRTLFTLYFKLLGKKLVLTAHNV